MGEWVPTSPFRGTIGISTLHLRTAAVLKSSDYGLGLGRTVVGVREINE